MMEGLEVPEETFAPTMEEDSNKENALSSTQDSSAEKTQGKGKGRKRRHPVLRVLLCVLVVLVAAGLVFCRFGGFGTGASADAGEFANYAAQTSDIAVPEGTRIVALGEATHGNVEFQQLKLDVFKTLVERNGVRAFALEADCGCCEVANRYIHGADGTAEEAAASLGFQIYSTKEMADLLSWMRSYNETAAQGEDVRLYGFDMQRYEKNYRYLIEGARDLGIDTAGLEQLLNGEDLDEAYTNEQRAAEITAVRDELLSRGAATALQTAHFADILLQNIELGETIDQPTEGNALRDALMAQNALWILEQEEARGNEAIFVSAHNGHVEQNGSYDGGQEVMGHLLADELGKDAYFVIGTDFYKSVDNLPTYDGKRSTHTFYSRDPLAKAAKKCGLETCWLDFSAIPDDSPLKAQVTDYCWMGSVGDIYNSLLINVLPMSYRVWRSPAETYDGVILVANAHPIQIVPAE